MWILILSGALLFLAIAVAILAVVLATHAQKKDETDAPELLTILNDAEAFMICQQLQQLCESQ